MTKNKKKEYKPRRYRFILSVFTLFLYLLNTIGCSTSQTVVEKTAKTFKRTTQSITRTITLSDRDLARIVGIFDFENKSLRESKDFQNIFHKGLPDYINENCQGIIVASRDDDTSLNQLKKPPRLKSGIIDNYSLAIIGRQLGLNAIVIGSLEDIRIRDELKGILWTKDTHHYVQVFIRVEVLDTRTGTKILDSTFNRSIEVEDLEYQLIRESKTIKLPELNETLSKLLTDIGDHICDAVRDQPWTGYIIKIEGDKYIISAGTQVGLQPGDILEVYDSSRIIEGVEGQRFFTPGLKIGEIEIVNITDNRMEATLVSGEDIHIGSTVQRK